MKYSNSIIDSTVKYLNNLQYLARQDDNTVKDIYLLIIINEIYKQSDWYNFSEIDKSKLLKIMNDIILNNSNLVLPIEDNYIYLNVNINQDNYTWKRIYDNLILT